jgi:hypothetical protein
MVSNVDGPKAEEMSGAPALYDRPRYFSMLMVNVLLEPEGIFDIYHLTASCH